MSSVVSVSPAVTAVKCLPPVDNLTIDNMDDLPPIDRDSSVSQLSKTLIEFLLTRHLAFLAYIFLYVYLKKTLIGQLRVRKVVHAWR